MTESQDTWPLPEYNPGSQKHLHALGVIAVTFAAFERSVDDLYRFHPREQKLPDDLIDLYYYSLNEEKRIQAVRDVFRVYEESSEMRDCLSNLLDYFLWCRNARNQLLHAEHYPAAFGGERDTLHLIKRVSKQSPRSGYMKFRLTQLRTVADQMRTGLVQSAEINIHLRFRDKPPGDVPRAAADIIEALPSKLHVPPILALNPTP
jgi:hypothetical protein